MSIGKLQAALAAATNEVTVAAANINFDFTLVKYEAPKEYQPLGALLSLKRKRDAESGTTHITARRLGALFEGVCPETPNLVAAYGKRVSEIADAAAIKNTTDYTSSIFAAYSGIDGTSIWAAATSSRAGLPVHLLSCMLARVFEAPEAISIWVELVKERRRHIAEKLEGGESLPFSLAAAATQQEISRSQLAEWDGSARAWLRTADSIKEREQTQLRLVLENINLPVNAKTAVFSSVTNAWRSALETMENLVSGMPQAVQDGAAILGLSAWHLYPDMAVFASQTTEISMRDELVCAGGVLSLGLTPNAKAPLPGVYWCLSLSNMRYYGLPVHSEERLSVDPKRITFPQFRLVVLGIILESWKVSIEDTTLAIRIILEMAKPMQEAFNFRKRDRWINFIRQPAVQYFEMKGTEKEMATRLINLGRRRAHGFIHPQSDSASPPYFGLLNIFTLLDCLKDNEARILFLRRIAARVPELSNEFTVVRYYEYLDEGPAVDLEMNDARFGVELSEEEPSDDELSDENLSDEELPDEELSDEKLCLTPSDEKIYGLPGDDVLAIDKVRNKNRVRHFATLFPQLLASEDGTHASSGISGKESHHRWLSMLGRSSYPKEEQINAATNLGFDSPSETFFQGQRMEYLFGDVESAAIFMKRDRENLPFLSEFIPSLFTADLLWCLESGLVSTEKLYLHTSVESFSIYKTLQTLTVVEQIYSSLRGATISVGSLAHSIHTAPWFVNLDRFASTTLDFTSKLTMNPLELGLAFSIVAYFEGAHMVEPTDLQDIIAISAGDSIYVPKQLLCDPFQPCQSHELERILGNIGKPGFVMLSSPQGSPMVRELDPSRWRVSSNGIFDGRAEDCFGGTSLHLSFTDYHVPMFQRDSRGQRDSQLTILECVISIRDAGVWVADLDVLRVLDKSPIYRVSTPLSCHHIKTSAPLSRLVAVGCWEDVLDYPPGIIVVKANGNAVARLAVTAFLAQHPQRPAARISVCPSNTNLCWECIRQQYDYNVFVY